MLEFRIEWEDEAPGITSPPLRSTWARLEIRADDRVVTQFWSKTSRGVREGVHTSLFPIVRWATTHWWNIFNEGIPSHEVLNGARIAAPRLRSWFERHNPFLSREGMPYPDLTIYREDELVGVHWSQDPNSTNGRGRFIDSGSVRAEAGEMEASFRCLVDAVLERLEGTQDLEVEELRRDWKEITHASADERALCRGLAALGLDPYGEVSSEIEELVAGLQLEEGLARDLLATAAAAPESLKTALLSVDSLVESVTKHTRTPLPRSRSADAAQQVDARPYEAGYARAATLRQELGINEREPLEDLDSVVRDYFGGEVIIDDVAVDSPHIHGMVQHDGITAFSASQGPHEQQRFLLARALHHWAFTTTPVASRRLLTRSHDWQQASSRAFAAELLAPAAALESRIGSHGDWEGYDELSGEFGVSSRVIAHQCENHGLS